MRSVRFATGGTVEIPELSLPDGGSVALQHAVAMHLVRKVRKLKANKWFVQVATDGRGGYIGFHGSDEQLSFKVI